MTPTDTLPSATVIDLDAPPPWPASTRAEAVVRRAVAASVADVRKRGPHGVHLALGRLTVAADRASGIDAEVVLVHLVNRAGQRAACGVPLAATLPSRTQRREVTCRACLVAP